MSPLHETWDVWFKDSEYRWELPIPQIRWDEFVVYALDLGHTKADLIVFAKERWHLDNRPNLDDLGPSVDLYV